VKILHLTPYIGNQSFGLGQVALNLVKAQVELGHHAEVWSADEAKDGYDAAGNAGLDTRYVRSFGSVGPEIAAISPSLYREGLRAGKSFDVIHQHGIWTSISYVNRSLAARYSIPSVVAPHGSLERSVVRKSAWKKRIASFAYEASNLSRAACLHAVASSERTDLRDYGLRNPVAVITNGISREWLSMRGDGVAFRAAYGLPKAARIALFLSRIAPKKGLPMLLEAWARIIGTRPGWMLVIVGSDEDGHLKHVEALSRELDISGSVRFLGPVFGPQKRDAFAAAELFVLPSYSEGFPVAVLESLGAGVPAIVSKASAWERLETKGCGWWVDTSVDGVTRGLVEATAMSSEALGKKGRAGRDLVANDFSWAHLAGMTIELYQWLKGARPQPGFVCP
jgi:glycosyltransferase involved in cell wall biosynthesis